MTAPLDALTAARGDELLALRDALAAAGYTEAAVAWLDSLAPRHLRAARVPLLRWALRSSPEAWAACARLFLCDDAVSEEAVAQALGEDAPPSLRSLGVVQDTPDGLRARFRITPFHELLVVSDPEWSLGPGPNAHAPCPDVRTAQLAAVIDVAGGGEVLDFRCGTGALALLAAKRGARATGVDGSPRAVQLACINARLNDLDRACELLDGGLAAVRGRSFDRIVAGPRATPGASREQPIDDATLDLLAALPDLLAPNGRALLRVDVPDTRGASLPDRVRDALGDARASVLVLAAPGPSADDVAIERAAAVDPTLGDRYAREVVAQRERLAAGSTLSALVQIRSDPPAGPGWTVVTEASTLDRCTPRHLDRLTRGLDVASLPDEELLAAVVRLTGDARLVHSTDLVGVHEDERLVFRRSPFAEQPVDREADVLLAVFSQPTLVADAVTEYAEACEQPPSEVQEEVLVFVRTALARGLLVP